MSSGGWDSDSAQLAEWKITEHYYYKNISKRFAIATEIITCRHINCVSMSCVNNCCSSYLKLSQAATSLLQSTYKDWRPFKYWAQCFPVTQVSTLYFTQTSRSGLLWHLQEKEKIYKPYPYLPVKLTFYSSFTNAGMVVRVRILKVTLFCSCQHFLEIGNAN